MLDGTSLTRHPFDPDAPPQSADVPLLIGSQPHRGHVAHGADDPDFDLTWETLPAAIKPAFPEARREEDHRQRTGRTIPSIEAPELFFMAGADNRFFAGSVTARRPQVSARAARPSSSITSTG